MTKDQPGNQRIDQWLWYSRLMKTRTAAKALITNGRVRINSQKTIKPNHKVTPGDTLTIRKNGEVHIVYVKAIGSRRGPYSEAQELYALERTPPQIKKSKLTIHSDALREPGTGRPTKKQRREIVRFKEQSQP